MECPVCSSEYPDALSLQNHVNSHFEGESEDEDGEDLAIFAMSRVTTRNAENIPPPRAAVEDDVPLTRGASSITTPTSSMMDDGKSQTANPLLPLYDVGHWLMCDPCDHFSSSGAERGRCGYKNLQMVLSAMMRQKTFRDLVFNGKDWFPSVLKIQQLIEVAWRSGFDTLGQRQLNGRVQNTRKWIGATEVVALLSSLSIRCRLVEFTATDRRHGQAVFDYVRQYLRSNSDFHCPLYLQYHGHSVCIVGLDLRRHGFLVLDPSVPTWKMRQLAKSGNPNSLVNELFHSVEDFDEKQYQIVVVSGVMTSEAEYERSKVLENIREVAHELHFTSA